MRRLPFPRPQIDLPEPFFITKGDFKNSLNDLSGLFATEKVAGINERDPFLLETTGEERCLPLPHWVEGRVPVSLNPVFAVPGGPAMSYQINFDGMDSLRAFGGCLLFQLEDAGFKNLFFPEEPVVIVL